MQGIRKTTINLLFLLGFILAQSTIIVAEFDHPLHEPDEACDVCLAVQHVSGGAIHALPTINTRIGKAFHHNPEITASFTAPFLAYTSRAPPVG